MEEQTVEQSLYAKREKIYPREVHGLFANLRILGVSALLGLYYLIPWFMWEGRQAVLFDLPERKFYIFNMVFWPQDLIYLALLLAVASLTLFFFTALAGRLWCGYACPQTVWTEVFLWIERKIEGDRPKQIKLDKQDWNSHKIITKSGKHAVWLIFSLYTGFTFVGFFTPIRELGIDSLALQVEGWALFWIIFYGLATYGNAGWLREQVCIYMCPYARFQSAMIDKDSLIISYNAQRGDPRGSRKRGTDPEEVGLGSCIDCGICVQVCPTGIDIRDGLQYQCIGCAACVDACDDVMDKMSYPHGLVSYTTLNRLEGKITQILRPRIVIYAVLLIALTLSVFYAIYNRSPIALDVIRDRNSLFHETDDGLVQNVYTLKLINMAEQDHRYQIDVEGIDDLKLQLDTTYFKVDSGSVLEVPARLEADPEVLKSRSNEIRFIMTDVDNPALSISEEGRFIGPIPSH